MKRRAKNNVKPVTPRPQFYQASYRKKIQNKEEEDLEGDLNKILGRTAPATQEDMNIEEQRDREAIGEEDRIQEGEEMENQPLHIIVEISTDEESDHHEGEENQREEEVGDPETEESVEERPDTSRTTRAGRKTRKPERFREAGQVQLSPKERSRRKSRAKFKKFRDEK